ncbi:hypothetical protein GCM10025876_09530 [Demequina litorisediminis]|uniref:Secreted protein n=1 Tax=Demequina litorisediminis TaxID=1849022 RepID=A0ABQ6IAC3_9MICO|nr:hypothetical protein GCM10025876_09530 [Demequina litorisediminis]
MTCSFRSCHSVRVTFSALSVWISVFRSSTDLARWSRLFQHYSNGRFRVRRGFHRSFRPSRISDEISGSEGGKGGQGHRYLGGHLDAEQAKGPHDDESLRLR